MIVPSQSVKIVVATKPVDFRKGHDGLAAVVQNELRLDPHSGIIVVFRAKRGDRIKVLLWDGTGLVMIYKRLEDSKFAWPAVHDVVMRHFIWTAPPTQLKRRSKPCLVVLETSKIDALDWRRVYGRRVHKPLAAE